MKKEKILVSACFLAKGYKYDGKDNINEKVISLQKKYDFVLICPEVMGGLSTPRDPSEQIGEKVISNKGKDVTINFINGAQKALSIANANNCKKALLKAKSPSCGKGLIYDGTFTHTIIEGNGKCCQLLLDNDIEVFTEDEIDFL